MCICQEISKSWTTWSHVGILSLYSRSKNKMSADDSIWILPQSQPNLKRSDDIRIYIRWPGSFSNSLYWQIFYYKKYILKCDPNETRLDSIFIFIKNKPFVYIASSSVASYLCHRGRFGIFRVIHSLFIRIHLTPANIWNVLERMWSQVTIQQWPLLLTWFNFNPSMDK